jgi:hypothetical protein
VKGSDAARRERWHWQAQRGIVVEWGVSCPSLLVRGLRSGTITRGSGTAGTVGSHRRSSTYLRYWQEMCAGGCSFKSTKRSRSLWCGKVICTLRVASYVGALWRSPLPPLTRHSSAACCCLTSHDCCMPQSLYLPSLTPVTFNLHFRLSLSYMLPFIFSPRTPSDPPPST